MTHGNGGHDGGMHVCMTGHSAAAAGHAALLRLRHGPVAAGNAQSARPTSGTEPGRDVQPRYLTGGFLGAAYSPLRVGQDLDNPSNPTFA